MKRTLEDLNKPIPKKFKDFDTCTEKEIQIFIKGLKKENYEEPSNSEIENLVKEFMQMSLKCARRKLNFV